MPSEIVCGKCGGSDIATAHITMYDPNGDGDSIRGGGTDYPEEYQWCYDCDTEVYYKEEE